MTLANLSPRAVYRDARLGETDRRVLLTAIDEGMLDVGEFRELKLSALGAVLGLSRSVVCRSLDRLVEHGYLERDPHTVPRTPQRYRVKISALVRTI